MVKRKASITMKPTEPKTRKRQAVTKAVKKATIALIQHNAVNSPLLSLPSEVRERILKHLLGDKLIHIRYLDMNEEKSFNTARNLLKANAEKEGSFRHAICSSTSSHDAQEAALGDSACHKDCEIYDQLTEHTRREIMIFRASAHCPMQSALAILPVCRQLYEESNFILWATNTFSFDHGGSLMKFGTSLNPAQKRNMKKMHIILHADLMTKDVDWCDKWGEALTTKCLSMFRGIESLSLCIEHSVSYSYRFVHQDHSAEDCDDRWKTFLKRVHLERLRVLPIKRLNLAMSNAMPRRVRQSASVSYLSEELKTKYIRELSETLLDPKGADVQKALDAELLRCWRERVARDNERVEDMRLRRAHQKVQATRLRSQLLEQSSSKRQDAADQTLESLHDGDDMNEWDRLERRAQSARTLAKKAADSLQIWERRLNQRQMLANAKAAKAVDNAQDVNTES